MAPAPWLPTLKRSHVWLAAAGPGLARGAGPWRLRRFKFTSHSTHATPSRGLLQGRPSRAAARAAALPRPGILASAWTSPRVATRWPRNGTSPCVRTPTAASSLAKCSPRASSSGPTRCCARHVALPTPRPGVASLGHELSTRILGRRTAPFHLSLFLTASRMVLPKILVLACHLARVPLATGGPARVPGVVGAAPVAAAPAARHRPALRPRV